MEKKIRILTTLSSIKQMLLWLFLLFVVVHPVAAKKKKSKPAKQTIAKAAVKKDSITKKVVPIDILPAKDEEYASSTTSDKASQIIALAKKQLGMPYIYASASPANGGFDCSGFVYYVMTNFKYKVPRTSKDYMNFGTTIAKENAQKGDVILFTGTDASTRVGGHVGIVLENTNGDITFIHSSSGKAKGVTISKLSESYYTQRFLKIIRVIK